MLRENPVILAKDDGRFRERIGKARWENRAGNCDCVAATLGLIVVYIKDCPRVI